MSDSSDLHGLSDVKGWAKVMFVSAAPDPKFVSEDLLIFARATFTLRSMRMTMRKSLELCKRGKHSKSKVGSY